MAWLLFVAWVGAASAGTEVLPRDLQRARDEIAALRGTLTRHDELYHRQASPETGDYDYDRLKQRLTALEQAFPTVASESVLGFIETVPSSAIVPCPAGRWGAVSRFLFHPTAFRAATWLRLDNADFLDSHGVPQQ